MELSRSSPLSNTRPPKPIPLACISPEIISITVNTVRTRVACISEPVHQSQNEHVLSGTLLDANYPRKPPFTRRRRISLRQTASPTTSVSRGRKILISTVTRSIYKTDRRKHVRSRLQYSITRNTHVHVRNRRVFQKALICRLAVSVFTIEKFRRTRLMLTTLPASLG